jgi:hypothetical protein
MTQRLSTHSFLSLPLDSVRNVFEYCDDESTTALRRVSLSLSDSFYVFREERVGPFSRSEQYARILRILHGPLNHSSQFVCWPSRLSVSPSDIFVRGLKIFPQRLGSSESDVILHNLNQVFALIPNKTVSSMARHQLDFQTTVEDVAMIYEHIFANMDVPQNRALARVAIEGGYHFPIPLCWARHIPKSSPENDFALAVLAMSQVEKDHVYSTEVRNVVGRIRVVPLLRAFVEEAITTYVGGPPGSRMMIPGRDYEPSGSSYSAILGADYSKCQIYRTPEGRYDFMEIID